MLGSFHCEYRDYEVDDDDADADVNLACCLSAMS